MDEVIRLDKSLAERLREYRDLLPVNFSEIQKEWSFYLELTLDPNGWQAVWKIPRVTCEALKIPFPSIVLVFVLDVDFKNLQALVKVLAVQDDDIHIPDRHRVPLIQLWVTKDQDQSIALNLPSTANAIDILRFFYTKLFMPWDDELDNFDWKEKHLESRLRLYYDMKNGIIPRPTAEHINSLLTEARRLQAKREALQEDVSSDTETELFTNKNFETLLQLHVRLLEIKSEIEILEDPLLRKVIIKRQNEVIPLQNNDKPQFWLIFEQGQIEDYLSFLEKVKNNFGNTISMSFTSSLANVLEMASTDSTFILNKSVHNIRTTGALETGGCLIGVSDRLSTTVTSERDDIMFDFMGENVKIKNLTIDAKTAKCAILVRNGKVTLENVKITGDGFSTIHQGIIVLSGAELELINCEINRFCTAIVGNANSKITLYNCEIHDVNYGLKVFDDCLINAENSSFHDCKEYGIVVETEENKGKSAGKFEILKIIPHVKLDSMSGINNSKGDAVISHKSKIRPIEDLFANPNLDLTICDDNDTEMSDNFNNITVIENDRIANISPATV